MKSLKFIIFLLFSTLGASIAVTAQTAQAFPPGLRQRITLPKPKTIKLIPNKNFAGIFLVKFAEGSHVRYRDDSPAVLNRANIGRDKSFMVLKEAVNGEEAKQKSENKSSAQSY